MLDLRIDLLRLQIEGAAGQEHRLAAIAARAADVLAGRLDERWPTGLPASVAARLDSLYVPPIALNLRMANNEQAAGTIADALVWAIAGRLR